MGGPAVTTLMGTNSNKRCALSVNSAECDARVLSSCPGPSAQKAESVPARGALWKEHFPMLFRENLTERVNRYLSPKPRPCAGVAHHGSSRGRGFGAAKGLRSVKVLPAPRVWQAHGEQRVSRLAN